MQIAKSNPLDKKHDDTISDFPSTLFSFSSLLELNLTGLHLFQFLRP